jgi:hypothetical protein
MASSAAHLLSSTSSSARPIPHSTLGRMREFSGFQFRPLGAATGMAYSKLCCALAGKATLTPDEQQRLERVLVSALRRRQREIEKLLRDAPIAGGDSAGFGEQHEGDDACRTEG